MTPARKIWWWIGGIVAVLLIAIAVAFNIAASRAWKKFEERTTAKLAEVKARTHERPALWGETTEGKAWEFYDRAYAAALAASRKYVPNKALDGYACKGEEEFREGALEILGQCPTVPGLVREGAHAREGAYPTEWERGFNANIPGLIQATFISELLATHARERMERDDPIEAIRTLLDGLQFSSDHVRNGTVIAAMIALAIEGQQIDIVRDWVTVPPKGWTRESLEVLLQGLVLHEKEAVSCARTLETDYLIAAMEFLRSGGEVSLTYFGAGGTKPLVPGDFPHLWRYGFSRRLMIADGMEEYDRVVRSFAEAGQKPWNQAEAQLQSVRRDVKESSNVLVYGLAGTLRINHITVHRRSQLALLRAALQLRLSGGFPEKAPSDLPQDPFGTGPISYRRNADGSCTLWSAGTDGVGNGGTGGWGQSAKDIVLELKQE